VAVGVDLDRGQSRGRSQWYAEFARAHLSTTTHAQTNTRARTEPKFPHSFVLIGPLKQYLLRFASLQDKHTWMGNFNSAIKKVINDEIAPDENRRYGCYRFPKEEGEYAGWWLRGKIHGDGVFSFFNNRYSGEWENNRKCGTGSFECVTGETYFGQWAEDRPEGFGTFKYQNGDIYEGMWKNGFRDGRVCGPNHTHTTALPC